MRTRTELLAELDAQEYDFHQFELMDFAACVSSRQRREIVVEGMDLAGTTWAMWLATARRHYIFYNRRMHRVHRQHSVLHELAHILLRHQGQPLEALLSSDEERAWLRGLSMDTLGASAAGRRRLVKANADDQEREAEALVFLILERLLRAERRAARAASSSIGGLRRWVAGMAFDG